MNREEMLLQLKLTNEWDLVIIGGGATGLGAAVDAASRGYKTLLVEQSDFGKGTSSRSTKLVHGGVRYLAQGNIKLVMQALRERGYLLKNAPHITRSMAFVVPVYHWIDKWFYGIGLKLYDLLAGQLSLGKTKWLNRKQTLAELPGIDGSKLKGGILYYDGQFDDARLAIDLASTAAAHGAAVLNYCKAISFAKEDGKIAGIKIKDQLSNEEYALKSRAIINATGVFTDEIMEMDQPDHEKIITFSQGIHLVIDKNFFPGDAALMIPKTEDGRVLFAVPWHEKVVLGTTDTPVARLSVEPKPLEAEITFILQHANTVLNQSISEKDVRSMFAGLRPLVKKTGVKNTSLLNRDHSITVSASGLVTITGGKWTTYRKMAEEVVNKVIDVAKLQPYACKTKQIKIAEADSIQDHLSLYGNAAATIRKMMQQEPGLRQLIHPNYPYTLAEVKWFIEQEMAMTVEDILARRTRLLFLDAQAAIEAAPEVAEMMKNIMKKDNLWASNQVKAFKELAMGYIANEYEASALYRTKNFEGKTL